MIEDYRKFYDKNGYLPHKAAKALISIAMDLELRIVLLEKVAEAAKRLVWRCKESPPVLAEVDNVDDTLAALQGKNEK